MCKMLGQNDIEACIAAVTAAPTDQSNGEILATEPAEPLAMEPVAPPAVVEEPAAIDTPIVPEPEAIEPPSEPVAPTVDEPVQPEPLMDEAPAPSADQPSDVAAPIAEDTPQTDQTSAETTVEAPAAEKPAVEVNPAGTPIPRDLGRAIASYEQANMQLGLTVVGTPEAEAAQAGVQISLAEIRTLCEQGGQADFDACLAAYGVALTPVAVAMQEAPQPEPAEIVAPENTAPILDSAKDAQLSSEPLAAEPVQTEQAPAPVSDAAAQSGAIPESIPSIVTTTGTRIATQPRREQPPQAKVVDQSGLRIVFQFNNQLIIANQADTRLNYGATERYVEQLPHGRTRETIARADGSSLVTVYNRNGDILHRSHFDKYGNETVFSYVQENYDQDLLNWHDPGMDLPPLRLTMPADDYVLDAQRSNLDSLTGFLDSPPVEQVQRLYSIDEVKRSARLRDMVRRLEIGNLTFQTGAAGIPPDQIGALSIVANAMLDLIDKNPAETFLIEGHTDAVGSDNANLILSDQRAYSVAITLTEVFGVPPENIATQGYGERYLKVNTDKAERLNRRVTVRRVTPLVAPVAG